MTVSTLTITSANLGQTILTDGILHGVKFTQKPNAPGAYLTLLDTHYPHPRRLFNGNVSNMFIPPGTDLLVGGDISYHSMTVVSCPTGAHFLLTYDDGLHPAPVLDAINPTTAVTDDGNFILTCTGSDFLRAVTIINFNGVDQTTGFVGHDEIFCQITPSEYEAGTVQVYVHHEGNNSASLPFVFTDPTP